MSKPSLYIDIDNTIIPTNEIMPRLYEKLTGVKPKSYKTKDWNCRDVFDNPDKEVIHKLFEIKEFFDMARPYKRCLRTIFNLSKYYDIYFVSVGTPKNLELKREWLKDNFPFVPEENYILLEQIGKADSIDKSCIKDGVVIDDNISALLSTKDCFRIMYQPYGDKLSWQDGYEDLLIKGEIHKVVTEWDQELEDYLIEYANYLER